MAEGDVGLLTWNESAAMQEMLPRFPVETTGTRKT